MCSELPRLYAVNICATFDDVREARGVQWRMRTRLHQFPFLYFCGVVECVCSKILAKLITEDRIGEKLVII